MWVYEILGGLIPLGMFEGKIWDQATVQIEVGGCLIMYSDGVPEAQNSRQEEFGEARLLESARKTPDTPAAARQSGITEAVAHFVDGAPQFDNITLMLLTRLK